MANLTASPGTLTADPPKALASKAWLVSTVASLPSRGSLLPGSTAYLCRLWHHGGLRQQSLGYKGRRVARGKIQQVMQNLAGGSCDQAFAVRRARKTTPEIVMSRCGKKVQRREQPSSHQMSDIQTGYQGSLASLNCSTICRARYMFVCSHIEWYSSYILPLGGARNATTPVQRVLETDKIVCTQSLMADS